MNIDKVFVGLGPEAPNIVTAGNAALRLARFEALAGLLLLMRGENRFAAEI